MEIERTYDGKLRVAKLSIADLDYVKQFIIDQHRRLDNKDFFIIEDIDTELPVIFNSGIVLALFCDDQIVGLQALDLSLDNSDNLKTILEDIYLATLKFYELGWSMIRKDYRGKHYAKILLRCIMDYVDKQKPCTLIATVHPLNRIAIELYQNFGFQPILTTKYFGYSRVFLIKEVM